MAVKNEFIRDNPNFAADEMNVSGGNNYLTAVSFCMKKDRDCRANVVGVTPVR